MHTEPELWHALARPPRRPRPGVAAGPGRRRSLGDPALRQLGRRAVAGGLPTLCPSRLAQGAEPARAISASRRIHFGVGTGELLGLMADAGADVVGVDWRVPLSVARRRIGPGKAVAGQSRSGDLPAPAEAVAAEEAIKVLVDAGRAPGTSSTSATACCRRPILACSPVVEFVHSAALPPAADGLA